MGMVKPSRHLSPDPERWLFWISCQMMRDLLNRCHMNPHHGDFLVVRCLKSASAEPFAVLYRIGMRKRSGGRLKLASNGTGINDLKNGYAKKQTFV